MENLIIFEMITEMGSTNLGKYTLPKMLALVINVEDVLIKQAEK